MLTNMPLVLGVIAQPMRLIGVETSKREELIMECNCSIYEHDICFDGVITYFSYDCLCCRNTSEEQEEES